MAAIRDEINLLSIKADPDLFGLMADSAHFHRKNPAGFNPANLVTFADALSGTIPYYSEQKGSRFMQRFAGRLMNYLNSGTVIANFCKYTLITCLVILTFFAFQIFKASTQSMPETLLSHASGTAAVSRHSTLSAEVFYKFINNSSQRMYPRLSREIVDSAIKYSEKYDLSPILVLAIVKTESEFYPFALSKQNAKGLMQINPAANEELLLQKGIFKESADIFDPERSIEAGCFLLRKFINESPDFNTALDKYLGADSIAYKAQIHAEMGKILLLGITEDINRTSQHKIAPVVKVEANASLSGGQK
jgi:hypothetical protein